jgi:RNA-directed DNA polymerase
MNGKASKIWKTFIPKPDGSLRPLGIPTMEDRAKQMLMKIVLEPE